MLSENYTEKQRRALNQIWNAAGEYGFEPLFLAQESDGEPNFYMNCIVGLVHKWYGEEMPAALFHWWEGDAHETMLDELAWLALEHGVYEKEVALRPILRDLRQSHAQAFFDNQYQLSRQEWMAKNQLVYTIQKARWKNVLGQKLPVLTPYERKLYEAVALSGSLNAEEADRSLRESFQRLGLFDGEIKTKGALRIHFDGKWALAMTRFLPVELVKTDRVKVSSSKERLPGDGRGRGGIDPRRARFHLKKRGKDDCTYIRESFGALLYPPERLGKAEQELCTGNHLNCHLWVTTGNQRGDSELAKEMQIQHERNQAAYAKNIDLYQSALSKLTSQIRNCMLVHRQPRMETARQGELDSGRVWREELLGDDRVFIRSGEENKPSFSVELMLDASASRLHMQETIAAQGYILAESLKQCGIPVRVTSFCSLRGYTVLSVLKSYQDKNGGRSIFDYFASGWNRDGLVLRAAGDLIRFDPGQEGRHLIILLTDASPNDSQRIAASQTHPLGCAYEGAVGVIDAANEVRALQRDGIRVAAVFMGEKENVPSARQIYGKNLAVIRSMDQLAGAAGRLIQDEIRELTA